MSDIVTLSRLMAPPNGALVQKAHNGVMVALMVPPRIAEQIAIRDGEPADELHLTLAFLGEAADLVDEQRRELHETLHVIASLFAPLTGHLNGAGRFCNDDDEGDPFFVIPDLPALPALRQMVVGDLKWGDVPVSADHGFVPHITLKYVPHDEPNPFDQIERTPIHFDALTLMMAGERTDYMFAGHVGLEQKGGARHSRKEYKSLNRIVDLAMQLGGQIELEEKAGSRHSRRDRGLIQEIHDISKADLGAVCKSDKTDKTGPQLLPRMAPPLLELSSTLVKRAQRDAPNYQPASTVRTCNNCIFSSRVKSGEWCDKFEFVFADDYVCDAWEHRSPDNETPGLANTQKALALLQIIKRGGPTSGNFKHRSVKGKHGGSSPGGGHMRIGIRSGDAPGRVSNQVRKHRKTQAKGGSAAQGDTGKKSKTQKAADTFLGTLPDDVKKDPKKLNFAIVTAFNKGDINSATASAAQESQGLLPTDPGKKPTIADQAKAAKAATRDIDQAAKDNPKHSKETVQKYKDLGVSPLAADETVNNLLVEKVQNGELTMDEAKKVGSFHLSAKIAADEAGGTLNVLPDKSVIAAPSDALIGADLKTTGPIGPDAPSGGGKKEPPPDAGAPPERRGVERSGQEMEDSPVGEAWTNSLPFDEAESVRNYTGGSFGDINKQMRTGDDFGKESTIENIKNALDRTNLDEDTLVHRGINLSTVKELLGDDSSDWTGKKLRDPAFQSTSIDRLTASQFADCCPKVIFDITVPKGYKAGYLDHISNYTGEKELLLQAASSMRILGVTPSGNELKVEAEMLFD